MNLDKLKYSRNRQASLEQLSPFELKDDLIEEAQEEQKRTTRVMLNAGRGNPNWIATTPREAVNVLTRFALEECRRVMNNEVGMAGIPVKDGLSTRLNSFIQTHKDEAGVDLLAQTFQYGLDKHGFEPDSWALELTEGALGNQYPDPVRMLAHTETIVQDYIVQEMCAGKPSVKGKYNLFAVEGGTAAMCYVFDALIENNLLKKGDRIALGVPAFTPYLEIPQLAKYNFKVTYINGSAVNSEGYSTFQYPNEEIDKLGDKSIKAFFIINPTNPTSVQISKEVRTYLIKVVTNLNPNLMILTDDVYGTFVDGFESLLNDLPHNTLCVYSFSKYFGATGWRLGVIALHENNIYDKMLRALPQKEQEAMGKMYDSLSLHPSSLKFIDRMVANSRDVALNHTAGLSLPQQIQMLFFAAFALLDKKDNYKNACNHLVRNRYEVLWKGLNLPILPDSNRAAYYCEIDIQEWAMHHYGKEFMKFLTDHFEPVDIVFRLAEKSSIVLLNGGGFDGPEWSVRVSLANLNEEDYSTIGEELAKTMQEYVDAWKSLKK